MKFSSLKKIEKCNLVSTISSDTIDFSKLVNDSLRSSTPVIVNGIYLIKDFLTLLSELNSIHWIEPSNNQLQRTAEILPKDKLFTIMTSLELTRHLLIDWKLTNFQTIVLNNFHHKDPYTDLFVSNSKFIQNERKAANLPVLKIILLTYVMPIDFIRRLFDNSFILDIDNKFNDQLMTMESVITPQNYLEAVFQSIYLLFRNKIEGINPNINTSQMKVLVFLANSSDVKTAYKWIVSRIMNMVNAYVAVVDNNEVKKNLTVYSSLLLLSNCSDKNVLDSLNVQFDYVIDSGYICVKQFLKPACINCYVVEKIDLAESLVRSHYLSNPNGKVIQLYSIDNVNPGIDLSNYIKIRQDITDFIFCQIALGDKFWPSFSSRLLYLWNPLKFAIDNLIQLKLIEQKNSNFLSDNLHKNKVISMITNYQLTELGKKCVELRPINCQTALVLISALEKECFITCLTLVSLLEVSEDLFTNLYDPFPDHAEKLKAIYDGKDDLLFLIKLFRHFVNLTKDERVLFVRMYSLNKTCLTNATKIRTHIKEKFPLQIINKANSQSITECFVAAYPFQLAKYLVNEKVYVRPGFPKFPLQIDPYSFANDISNPPEYVFFYSLYKENDINYMKYVSPIDVDIWNKYSTS